MSENQSSIANLHHLLVYDTSQFEIAEIELQKVLPEWINWVSSLKFKAVLQKYLDLVQQHIEQLENYYAQEQIPSLAVSNPIMQGFLAATAEKLALCTDIAIKDACLLASIQVINHFKISAYGTAASFANTLGMEKQAEVFHQCEVNEKQIDDRLSQLAEHEINVNAKAPSSLHA